MMSYTLNTDRFHLFFNAIQPIGTPLSVRIADVNYDGIHIKCPRAGAPPPG